MRWRCCVLWFGLGSMQLTSGCGGAVPKAQDKHLERAAELKHAQELFDRGMAFSRVGDSVRAEHYINASIQAGFAEERAFPELISVCVSAGRLRSALNYAEPRLRLRPADVGLRYLVGSLHLGLGQTAEALSELETVLSIAPKEGRAHYLLGITLAEDVHDEAAAREHFVQYLELAPTGRYAPEVRLWLRQHPEVTQAPEAQASVTEAPAVPDVDNGQPAATADASSTGSQP
jgi:tetratricopeptide (TPR) repeat protein